MSDLTIFYPGVTGSIGPSSFPLLAPDGTAAAPSYSFTNSTNTGMYYSATQINWAVSGTLRASLSATAFTVVGNIAASNLSGTNTGDVTLATVGSSPANAGASLSGQVLTLQPADATHGGVVSTTTQTLAGDKTFSGTIAASNFSGSHSGTSSGTNTGDVTLSAIGASPNANGATLTAQALNLEPASASFGGIVTTGTQTMAGAKTWSGAAVFSSTIAQSSTSSIGATFACTNNDFVSKWTGQDTSSANTQQVEFQAFYNNATTRRIGTIQFLNTSQTAASSGGQVILLSTKTDGSNVQFIKGNETGIVTIGNNSDLGRHVLNASVATNGAQILTLTNGPTGTATNPARWVQIDIAGTTGVFPVWSGA